MNVFILNTGRCGSTTFVKACGHIKNYTAGHETRSRVIGTDRLHYADNHIEADNRLSWFLGRLDKRYGDGAFYVHLLRGAEETAISYSKRSFKGGIIKAYFESIVMGGDRRDILEIEPDEAFLISLDYCDTVNSNIELFLKEKPSKMVVKLENVKEDFARFWTLIGAEGNLDDALQEWDKKYNPTLEKEIRKKPLLRRVTRKIYRIGRKIPQFISEA